jgi:phage FluMu gp28-like protein
VARLAESHFFEGADVKQLEVRFPNGSVIYGLPANPDTARGYTGNVTLDEFAFHADADKIYSALFPTITRGYALEVISTPNGTQGKFYELAKAAGLAEAGLDNGRKAEIENRKSSAGGRVSALDFRVSPRRPTWSAHECDIYEAVRQGLKADLVLLRNGCEDDAIWQQEFCCQFVSSAENFFPPELLAPCLSAEASAETPLELLASARIADAAGIGNRRPGTVAGPAPVPGSRFPVSEFYLGIDIGRHRDRTVFWLDEVTSLAASGSHPEQSEGSQQSANALISPQEDAERLRSLRLRSGTVSEAEPSAQHDRVAVARLVRILAETPFDEQLAFARQLLSVRGPEGEYRVRRACVDATGMGAMLGEMLEREFAPRVEAVTFTAAVKEDLAFRTKRRIEQRLSLLPDTREVRRAFAAVKKFATPSGNLRFDAARTDAGHADEFWAKALADLAADSAPAARASDAYLVEGAPMVSPAAFAELGAGWSALEAL